MSLTSPVPPGNIPWLEADAFPARPAGSDFGYMAGGKMVGCTRDELVKRLSKDHIPDAVLVWTPESPRLILPYEVAWLRDTLKKRLIYQLRSQFTIGLMQLLSYGFLYWSTLRLSGDIKSESLQRQSQFYLAIVVLVAVVPILQSIFGMREVWRDEGRALEKAFGHGRFAAWASTRKKRLGWVMMAMIVALMAAQIYHGLGDSFAVAGLTPRAIEDGQPWRLVTHSMLHGNIFHILFNATSLLVLALLVEVVAGWPTLLVVYLASVIVGGLASWLLPPFEVMVGASGGIMGLIGYLAVFAALRRGMMPPGFLKSLLLSILLIAFTGLLAKDVIDNAAHAGGLVSGALVGLLLISRRPKTVPLPVNCAMKIVGAASGLVLATAAMATLVMLVC